MTSRTNRHAEGRTQGGAGEVAPADLESRRQLAVKRYLDGDPIERICRTRKPHGVLPAEHRWRLPAVASMATWRAIP